MNYMKVGGVVLAGIATLGLAALALPRHVSVSRSAVLHAAPADILSLAASNAGYQRFNPYKTMDPDLDIALFGPVEGVGSGFAFDGRDGRGHQTVAEVTDEKVVYAIDLGVMGTPTQSIAVRPVQEGTQVTWRVDSDLGFNPVFRVFGLFMEGMMGPTFELGLENLASATA